MADQIKPGDVVYLKSGGPAMTIVGEPPHGSTYICGWFIDDREYRHATIEAAALTTTPPDSKTAKP